MNQTIEVVNAAQKETKNIQKILLDLKAKFHNHKMDFDAIVKAKDKTLLRKVLIEENRENSVNCGL